MAAFSWLTHQETAEAEGHPRLDTARHLQFTTWRYEPLGAFLFGRLNLSPVGLSFIGILIWLATIAVSILLYHFFRHSAVSAFIEYQVIGWPYNVVLAVVTPAILATYAWLSRTSGRLFGDLHLDGVVERTPQHLHDLVVGSNNAIKNRICDIRWTYAALGIAALAPIYWILTGLRGHWAATPSIGFDIWINFVVVAPFATGLFYAVCIVVARELAVIQSLYRLFNEQEKEAQARETIRVRPWHPDGVGGLGRLSDYAVRFSYFIAACGFGLLLLTYASIEFYHVRGSLTDDFGVWLLVLVYTFGAPVVFFLTLGSAHRAMLKEKKQQLRAISDQLEAEYQKAQTALSMGKEGAPTSLERLKQLNELYQLTSQFPVWPFDVVTLRRFATAILSPFITAGISIGVGLVVRSL